MSDMNTNLQIVLEGLRVMCAAHEERLEHFSRADSAIDENFDFIVLDYLPGAVEAGLISPDTAEGIDSLFREAHSFLGCLSWQQEDGLLKARPEKVRTWQSKALVFIEQIEAHNKAKQAGTP